MTAEAATAACVARIQALEPALNAFEHIATEPALETARAVDKALAAGIDLGLLMGVPVAVKDLLAVDGMPATAGSNVDVSDLIGAEGAFVRRMRQAGCVFLGKTRTVEFALGGAGTNRVRGTPRNPWDATTPRAPGGSSSGSAVAAAAGSAPSPSARTPAARCVGRPPSAAPSGSRPARACGPRTGSIPCPPTLDTLAC